MGQLQWRLWLVGAATFLLGNASGPASSSHSLLYFRHAVLREGKSQFTEVTYLDSQLIQRYDRNTGRMRPLTLWIKRALDRNYWNMESFFMRKINTDFLKKMQDFLETQKHNQSKGFSQRGGANLARGNRRTQWKWLSIIQRRNQLHTQSWQSREQPGKEQQDHILQCIEGCIISDGKEINIHRDAVNGEEINGEEFHRERYYVQGNCILWLKRFLGMERQRKKLPIVKVTHQVSIDSLQALTCQAYGFYPKEISASWRKEGEMFNQTNSSVLIAPNSDGTFYASLSIQIDPKERRRYRCHVEHVSSSKPLDIVLQKTGPSAEVTTDVLNGNETVLNCSICSFYPEEIYATWMKDEEIWDQETYRGDTTRNWDGTYCTWISIEINSKEEDHYCCHVDHEALQETLSVKVSKSEIVTQQNPNLVLILCYVVPVLGILILLSITIGILCCKKRQRQGDYRPPTESNPNSSMDNAEKCPLKETEEVPPLNNTADEANKGDSPPSQNGIAERRNGVLQTMELWMEPNYPINIYEDNNAAIEISQAEAIGKRSRHIDIKCKHVRQLSELGFIKVIHCKTKDQTADVFTKPLDNSQHQYLTSKLCICI